MTLQQQKEQAVIEQFPYNPIKYEMKPKKPTDTRTVYPENYIYFANWTDKMRIEVAGLNTKIYRLVEELYKETEKIETNLEIKIEN